MCMEPDELTPGGSSVTLPASRINVVGCAGYEIPSLFAELHVDGGVLPVEFTSKIPGVPLANSLADFAHFFDIDARELADVVRRADLGVVRSLVLDQDERQVQVNYAGERGGRFIVYRIASDRNEDVTADMIDVALRSTARFERCMANGEVLPRWSFVVDRISVERAGIGNVLATVDVDVSGEFASRSFRVNSSLVGDWGVMRAKVSEPISTYGGWRERLREKVDDGINVANRASCVAREVAGIPLDSASALKMVRQSLLERERLKRVYKESVVARQVEGEYMRAIGIHGEVRWSVAKAMSLVAGSYTDNAVVRDDLELLAYRTLLSPFPSGAG